MTARRRQAGRIGVVGVVVLAVVVGLLGLGATGLFFAGKTMFDLLGENKELRAALSNLSAESQIGYAKVLEQGERDGQLYTRLLFVETDRDDPRRRVLEKEYEIAGDVVHFDALMVTFEPQLVMDGKERAIYLWRRVYGEDRAPAEGFAIEEPGREPQRYADIGRRLSLSDRELFWEEIWKLADSPDRLASAGVKAIYGNVVYRRLRPGLIYVFKVSNTGTLYPEVVPDL